MFSFLSICIGFLNKKPHVLWGFNLKNIDMKTMMITIILLGALVTFFGIMKLIELNKTEIKPRYYVIFYIAQKHDGTNYYSNCASRVMKGGLNQKEWKSSQISELKISDISILGFNEITESDFNDWIKE